MHAPPPPPPPNAEIVIDTPRFGFVKRSDTGAVDFVSPLPCPFNYGSVPDSRAADGDRIDAVVLGPRLPRGSVVRRPVRAVVRFSDAGVDDAKWVCAARPIGVTDRLALELFFRAYARLKSVLNAARGRRGVTAYHGLTQVR